MATFLWGSDLHLDHPSNDRRSALIEQLSATAANVVVITGDTSNSSRVVDDLRFLAHHTAAAIYFVLGNHDHYGSSVAQVRDAVTALTEEIPTVQWLPPAGVVSLDERTALVGVDGWADGRAGNPLTTELILNDDRLIREIAAQEGRPAKLLIKRALADADARRLATLIDRALPTADTIVVATHVPPFPEALPRSGRLSQPGWLPLMICVATGDVLRRAALANPTRNFLVLCGHTHVATSTQILPNLRCRVAGARHDDPVFENVRI